MNNFLWLFSDQHRSAALSCYGDSNSETLNLVSHYFCPGWENSNNPLRTTLSGGDGPQPIRTMKGYQAETVSDTSIAGVGKSKMNSV